MTLPMNAIIDSSLQAALKLQFEWGVESVTEVFPWNPLKETASLSGSRKGLSHKTENALPEEMTAKLAGKAVPKEQGETAQADSLAAFIDNFKEIPLARTATHSLMAEWHEKAKFVIIGEIPDADEDRSGRLFSGESGVYLEKILQSLCLKREQVSIVPSIPWRPPGGRPLLPHELEIATAILHKALLLTKDLPIVTMGATPLRLLKGQATQIIKARGTWHDFTLPDLDRTIRFLPTYHPLQLKAGPVVKRGLWHDLLLLADTINI